VFTYVGYVRMCVYELT